MSQATFYKTISNFCKSHKKIRIYEKVFSHTKEVLLKHSGVGSCFKALIETSTIELSDFNLDARFQKYDLFCI